MNAPKKIFHPALWVITNFVAMGIPFSMVIWVTGTLFKDLGHSDTEITIATGSVGIVWSLKPLWAGFLDKEISEFVEEAIMTHLDQLDRERQRRGLPPLPLPEA